MLYIVSGYMRSGTSMMMEALVAGGMSAAFSKARDQKMNEKNADDDYKPNESYWEIPLGMYGRLDFPRMYDNKLVKIMYWGLPQMRICPHRIVYMLREPDEIAESWERAFSKPLMFAGRSRATDKPKEWRQSYMRLMKRHIVAAETRRTVTAFTSFGTRT